MLWLEKRVAMIMMVIVGLVVVMVVLYAPSRERQHVLDVDANVHRVAIGEAKKVPGETVAISEAPHVDVAFGWHRVELSRSGSQLGHAERSDVSGARDSGGAKGCSLLEQRSGGEVR